METLVFQRKYRAKTCFFMTNISETFGIVFLKQKTTAFGIIGLIGHIPFYLLLWYYMFKLVPESFNLSRKQSVWMASIGAVVMVGLSYPVSL